MVEQALEILGPPIYVRHQVVHNRHVVESLASRGAVFINEISEIPPDSVCIFSAHGVSQQVRTQAQAAGLKVFDATCPLVTKVHMEVARYARQSYECVLIGHAGHPEIEGTLGQFDATQGGSIYLVESETDAQQLQVCNPERLAFVTQTTLSLKDTARIIAILKDRFPNIQSPAKKDICYATQNRQEAMEALAQQCDFVLVVGSPNSSNSNRLCELAMQCGTQAVLIDSAQDIKPEWVDNYHCIGITAGASAPELLVQRVIKALEELGAQPPQELAGEPEDIEFAIPLSLRAQTSETSR